MEYDIIVIGGGGAGLMAALSSAKSGKRVALFSKTAPNRSQSVMAQGGINAALGNVESDSVDAHIADTIKGGAGLTDEVSASVLCKHAPEIIDYLDSIGTPFNRTEEGKVDQRSFGGASRKRTCFSSDMTGHAIVHTLLDRLLMQENITLYSEYFLLELLAEDQTVHGARFIDIATGRLVTVSAGAVILATGGYASIFFEHTTNTPHSTGDGILAAYRIGAALKNMEFVQFHPTTLKSSSLLISEAARGAGAYLLNGRGERFVDELGTRDKVTKAIQAELDAGREVYLDMRHVDHKIIDHDLHHEAKQCRIFEGVDPKTELIPIKPSAHYTMGGIHVDTRTNVMGKKGLIEGLYACGETACSGAHGANRLGGNSLLEILVFGKLAGINAAAYSGNMPIQSEQKPQQSDISFLLKREGNASLYDLRKAFGEVMLRASVTKEEKSLNSALTEIETMRKQLEGCGIEDRSLAFNTNLVEYLEFANMLEAAGLYLLAAIQRKESRGSHIRNDFPRTDNAYQKASLLYRENGGDVIKHI